MATRQLSAFEKGALAALAPRASLAGALLEAWSELPEGSVQNARTLVAHAQLGVTEERATEEVLESAVAAGLLQRRGTGFAAKPNAFGVFPRLAFALASIQHYLTAVHQEATRVQVVLTRPPRPSALEEKLGELGWRTADLEATDHAFNSLVRSAQRRVIVMTPFFDERGAAWIQELFSFVSAGVERVLILRSLEDSLKRDYPCTNFLKTTVRSSQQGANTRWHSALNVRPLINSCRMGYRCFWTSSSARSRRKMRTSKS